MNYNWELLTSVFKFSHITAIHTHMKWQGKDRRRKLTWKCNISRICRLKSQESKIRKCLWATLENLFILKCLADYMTFFLRVKVSGEFVCSLSPDKLCFSKRSPLPPSTDNMAISLFQSNVEIVQIFFSFQFYLISFVMVALQKKEKRKEWDFCRLRIQHWHYI